MRRRAFIIIFALVSVLAHSQELAKYAVRGVVWEDNGKKSAPLAFSRIHVTDAEGALVAKSDGFDDGSFSFYVADGSYKMLIENTGHESRIINLSVAGKDLDLGNIFLKIGEEIAAASIESESFIKRRGSRVIYDVFKDPDADKIDMAKMITRIPELRKSARDGKIRLDDKPLGAIYVDKDENGMINKSRQYPMGFIKASYMRQVELILPGDPEYNNEEPILLIKLARALPFGFASELSDESSTKNEHTPSIDAVINTPWIGIGLNYQYGFEGSPKLTNESVVEMIDNSSEVAKTESTESSWSKSTEHNFGTNLFRSFANNLITFNASFNANYVDATSIDESNNFFYNSNNTRHEDHTIVESFLKSPLNIRTSVKLRGKFGEEVPGFKSTRKNSWGINYSYNDKYDERAESYPDYSRLSSSGSTEHRANMWLRCDDLLSSESYNTSLYVETGHYNRKYDDYSISPSDTNGLKYHQTVTYFDARLFGKIKGKIGYSLVLNGEYLANQGSFLNGSTSSPLDYSTYNLNPRIGAVWYLGRRGYWALSYGRQVSRPNVKQLNPYENKVNPHHIRTGNPYLKGSKTDSYSALFIYNPVPKWIGSINIRATYSATNGSIQNVTTCMQDGTMKSSFYNLGKSKNFYINSSVSFKLISYLRLDLLSVYSRAYYALPSGNKNVVALPRGTVSLSWVPDLYELHFDLRMNPSSQSVQSSKLIFEPSSSISVSRYFLKPNITVSLDVEDLLHKGGLKESVISSEDFIRHDYIERIGRRYILTIAWQFGRFKNTTISPEKAYDM
jgi:hypothetical protein